jgi:hypothetical protein
MQLCPAHLNLKPIDATGGVAQAEAAPKAVPAAVATAAAATATTAAPSVIAYSELTSKPYPAGVDPAKREAYLSDEEFLASLKMTKADFAKLPKWKQKNVKVAAKLW